MPRGAVAVLGCLLCLGISSVALADGPAPVRLKSRTFHPVPGLQALEVMAGDESRHLLVQLAEPYRPGLGAELAPLGLTLLRYLPEQTWIAVVAPGAGSSEALRERIRWAGALQPADKMPSRFGNDGPGAWSRQPDGRVELRIRLHDDITNQAAELARDRLTAGGATVVAPLAIFPGFTVQIAVADIGRIASLDEVLWISEGLPPPLAENDGSRARTGTDIVQAPPFGLSGAGTNAALSDAGTIFQHPDFAGRITLVETDSPIAAHGTHVCGTMAGDGSRSAQEGGGPLAYRGMAPGAAIFAWDYFDDYIAELEDAEAIYAIDVHNNSWGYGVNGANCDIYGDYDFIAPDLDAIVRGAGGRPMTVVFSAGNERDDGDCPLVEGGYGCINPPKPAKNILVVGAANSDDDSMTEFSSWGPVDDGRLRPDVVAPGCEAGGEAFIRSTLPGNGYGGAGWCGTSMAAPVVSGIVALLQEAYRGRRGSEPAPSLIKAILAGTAVDLGNPGPDYAFGHGRIDAAAAAVAVLGDTQWQFEIDHEDIVEFAFHVPGGAAPPARLTIVLAWDDPDAAPNASPALVNDLDLVLVGPSAQEVRPWVLDPLLPSAPAVRGIDTLNNMESVTVDNPEPGQWIARILGTNVPQGPQLATLMGFDLDPPAPPDGFAVANPTSGSLELSWIDDRPVDYAGTMVVRLDDGVFWGGPVPGEVFVEGQVIAPGVTVAYQRTEDHSSVPWLDTGLDPGSTYQYACYSFDDMRTYSIAATGEGTTTGASSVEPAGGVVDFFLGSPRPNPAFPADGSMVVDFTLGETASIRLRVLDSTGRLVCTLVDEALPAGLHVANWDGTDDSGRMVPSGVYFCELRSGRKAATRRVSWMR